MPPAARLLALAVVGYALSPIDLIPDFVPVLGLLDDLLILPLGIALTLRLIPPPLMAELRRKARGLTPRTRRAAMVAAGAIVLLWLALALGLARWLWPEA